MRSYLLFIFMFLSIYYINAQNKGILYAVVVGVSEYEESENNLTYCSKDAYEMYNLLKLHTPTNNLKILLNNKAKKDNIILSAKELFLKTKPEDIVIFYFSGHGNTGCFYTHDKKLEYQALKDIFKKTKAKRKIIFADACYSGDLRTSTVTPSSSDTIKSNVLLFLSSRSNQLSSEITGIRNGAYTYFLIAGLKGGADVNKDKIITAKELFNFVNPKVKEKTKGKQVPVMWGNFDDNMMILNWNK